MHPESWTVKTEASPWDKAEEGAGAKPHDAGARSRVHRRCSRMSRDQCLTMIRDTPRALSSPFLNSCYFASCTHTHEPDCAVRTAVAAGQISEERYQSYMRLRENA